MDFISLLLAPLKPSPVYKADTETFSGLTMILVHEFRLDVKSHFGTDRLSNFGSNIFIFPLSLKPPTEIWPLVMKNISVTWFSYWQNIL